MSEIITTKGDKQIVFLHIPKNSGSSFLKWINNPYPETSTKKLNFPHQLPAQHVEESKGKYIQGTSPTTIQTKKEREWNQSTREFDEVESKTEGMKESHESKDYLMHETLGGLSPEDQQLIVDGMSLADQMNVDLQIDDNRKDGILTCRPPELTGHLTWRETQEQLKKFVGVKSVLPDGPYISRIRESIWDRKVLTQDIKDIRSMAILRNPWKRMVSWYHYCRQYAGKREKDLVSTMPFKEFVKRFTENTLLPNKSYISKDKNMLDPSWYKQWDYIIDNDNNVVVDKLFYMDWRRNDIAIPLERQIHEFMSVELDEDVREFKPFTKTNMTHYPRLKDKGERLYSFKDYYEDDETIEIVSEFEKDIIKFAGYKFGKYNLGKGITL